MLYFNMKNVRVFQEDSYFQTTPNKIQTKNKDIYVSKEYKNKKCDLLPFSVIYGANASGKSTIVNAMELLREIVLSGKIYSDKANELLFNIGLYPFLHDYEKYKNPFNLGIGFIKNGHKYEYSISILFSMPKESYYIEQKIIEEKLIIDDRIKFIRDEYKINLDGNIEEIGEKQIIDSKDLYLCGSFKSNIETNEHFTNVYDWFKNDFIIISNIDSLRMELQTDVTISQAINIRNEFIVATSNMADYGPQELYYRLSNNSPLQMRSNYKVKGYIGKIIDTNAYNTESSGTIKLVDMTMLLINTLLKGATLVVDELDSSFHFGLIAEILKLFTNKEINTKGAQLIFTSHNPTFMSLTNIRKDQVYFVEKDNKSHTSELYSLTDFKTNSQNDVRNGEEFIKNYLSGKYGALPKFNFEETIVKYIKNIQKEKVKK